MQELIFNVYHRDYFDISIYKINGGEYYRVTILQNSQLITYRYALKEEAFDAVVQSGELVLWTLNKLLGEGRNV